MSEFIFCLMVAGIPAFLIMHRVWNRHQTYEETATIDERTLNPTAEEERWFRYYFNSFKFIHKYAPYGKRRAFWYAFKVGYTVGKMGRTIYPKEYEKYLQEKGGESHE